MAKAPVKKKPAIVIAIGTAPKGEMSKTAKVSPQKAKAAKPKKCAK